MTNTPRPGAPTADEVLARLLAGNERFVASKLEHPRQSAGRRGELTDGQWPVAAVLTCSDSRMSPEIIFDQGLGDLFVVRVAGNTANDIVLGSLEYATEHLHAPVVMVMGHSKCGAVSAAIAAASAVEQPEGFLSSLTSPILFAVETVKDRPGDLVTNAAKLNAKMVADQLTSRSPVLSCLEALGEIKIVASFHDMDSGRVELL